MTLTDWNNITNYMDSVGTTLKTFTFNKTQNFVKVTTRGNASVTYTIGSQSGTLTSGQSVSVSENITSFTLTATSGTQTIEVWATEDGTEKTEDTSNDVTTQLAEITKYIVGAPPHRHVTINSAYSQWSLDGTPSAVIEISQGTYNEYLNVGALVNNNRLVFRGKDKYSTIWQYGNGEYDFAPFIGGGNFTFENLTVRSHHDDNPSYVNDSHNSAYAIHLDFPSAQGKMVIKNCILKSEQDAGLGCGTAKNQEILVEDTELYSTAVEGSAGNHGALLYHSSNLAGQTGQKLTLKNVYAHSVVSSGIDIWSNGGSADTPVDVEIVNTISRSDFYEQYTGLNYEQRAIFSNPDGLLRLSQNSRGNNSERFNYINPQNIKLTNNDGTCIKVSDFNNGLFGFFRTADDPTQTLNTPVSGRAFSGYAISYDPSDLTIQSAFDVLNMFTKYTRKRYGDGSWSNWVQKDNLVGTTTERNAIPNTRLDSGTMFFDTTLNKPIWRNASNTAWIDATSATV